MHGNKIYLGVKNQFNIYLTSVRKNRSVGGADGRSKKILGDGFSLDLLRHPGIWLLYSVRSDVEVISEW